MRWQVAGAAGVVNQTADTGGVLAEYLQDLPGRRRFGGGIVSAGRLMKPLRRSLHVLSAVVAWVAAAPAGAEEVPYLMYVRGSEGPPATPLRVLWDRHDDANARITIDLGPQYEPALTRLGLGRVLKYDAKLDKAQFVVRDPELTRFVKVVATSIVQGLLQASKLPERLGAEARRRRPERGAAHHTERHATGGRHLAARHLSGAAEVRAAESCRI